ncbi:MAG: cytochrome c oxidase assembly protein [Geminicoccaceae bacterium]
MSARNTRTAWLLTGIIVGMIGLTAASVPLYRLFCAVTGYGGTPQRVAEVESTAETTKRVTVRFNADVDPDLPWGFKPVQREMEVQLGTSYLAFYEATNRSDKPIIGTAVYNVTPHKAGPYFSKIACFCFDEQVLQPGETVEMPVSFYVDPELHAHWTTDDVQEITLSYTFFFVEEAEPSAQAALDRQTRAPLPGVTNDQG